MAVSDGYILLHFIVDIYDDEDRHDILEYIIDPQ